jgi:thioredoxin-like negative regulator of GroEL
MKSIEEKLDDLLGRQSPEQYRKGFQDMSNGKIIFDDPFAQVRVLGKENTELHQEIKRLQAEHDHFRRALTIISNMPGDASIEKAIVMATHGLQLKPLLG